MSYVKSGLKKVLEGEYDLAETKVGRYHIWMKYDGYSAMVDINYLNEDKISQKYQICHWDSLNKTIYLEDEDILTGKKRIQLKAIIKAIKELGYPLSHLKLNKYRSSGKYDYTEDISDILDKIVKTI